MILLYGTAIEINKTPLVKRIFAIWIYLFRLSKLNTLQRVIISLNIYLPTYIKIEKKADMWQKLVHLLHFFWFVE